MHEDEKQAMTHATIFACFLRMNSLALLKKIVAYVLVHLCNASHVEKYHTKLNTVQ